MEHDTNIYWQHCRLGLAFAEDELRKCCQRDITYIQQELRKAFKSNVCIRETEMDIRRMKGWDSSELKFEHSCRKKPACYQFLNRIVGKLSTASKVNPYILLMNISLQDFKDDAWEIAKLFLEPWMSRCCRLKDLNAYCLFEMLGNLRSVIENDVAKTKKQSRIKTLHQEHIDKMRNIAEAVFLVNIEQITKEDRCIFLQAVINVLAFEEGPETDSVIQKIRDFMNLEDSAMANITLQNLTGRFAKTVDEAKDKDTRLRTQKADWLHEMLKLGIDTLSGKRKSRTRSGVPSSSQTKPMDIFRDVLHYLEKNVGPDAKDTVQHIFKLATGKCNVIPTYHFKKIQELLKRPKQHRNLEELLLNEAESTNYKTYFLGLLIMESVLGPYIKRKITLIHTAVANEFTRPKLCDVADTNDICRVDGVGSDEVKFKHECKESPQCSKFLQCVLDKSSPKCKQKQYRMFKRVNPQDCLTNVWDFAKLFMDPWMHTNKAFEDLDVFCLLTLLENVQVFDANQSNLETLHQKVNKARYDAFTLLQMGTKTMKKHTMNVRLHDLIYIIEEGIVPLANGAIQQLKDLLANKGHPFDIRRDREAKRQHFGQSLKKFRHGCWFKNIIAIRQLNPVFVDIVEGEINKLHEETVSTFGPKPCPRATSDDICKSANNTAKFRHKCPPRTLVACQKLLDIIKEHTADKVTFHYMLKGTDPQIWLDSPFDYARIFLKNESRCKRGFADCDMTALCGIVERCKTLMNMFTESLLKKIRNARNQTMHAAEMEISQQDMEENLDAILEFLQYMKSLKDTGDAAEAIDFIKQLQACDIRLLRRLYSDLIDGELPDTIMKYKHVKAEAKTLRQNINYMKSQSDRYCSLEERPDSPSPGCYDEETTAKKKGTTETLFSGDEDSIQPSTSSTREQSGRGEQTRDELTDRARGAKRVLQETGSEEPVLKKKRKTAEHILEMSEEQAKAVLMKTLDKDPDLIAEVIEETTSI